MAKSPLERQLEAQMKQEKQLANKQKREGERRAREQKKMEREAMIRERAASIVNGQPLESTYPANACLGSRTPVTHRPTETIVAVRPRGIFSSTNIMIANARKQRVITVGFTGCCLLFALIFNIVSKPQGNLSPGRAPVRVFTGRPFRLPRWIRRFAAARRGGLPQTNL